MSIIALEYHDVVPAGGWDASGFPGRAAATYKLAESRFREHLDAIALSGRSVGVTVGEALGRTEEQSLLLTFDDGGSSAAAIARLLDSRGWRAHVFIATDFIGTAGFLGREELVALHAAGHVVGTHSASHPTRMSRLAVADLRDEWRRSVGVLQDLLGGPVSTASVPGGYYSTAVSEAASEAGIEVLFTSEPVMAIERVSACTVLGRFTLRQHHSARYVTRLVGRSPLGRVAQWLHWNARKVGKLVGGSAYLRLRDARFGR